MAELFVGIIVGIVAGLAIFFAWGRNHRHSSSSLKIYSSIEEMRSVGELVVFKIITKEIVTTADHWLGEWGKKYFRWLASTKKMAMIFEFEINFRYDLRSPDFKIDLLGEQSYTLSMPPCLYDIYIRDISFYDEQTAKLLPWLLPDLLNRAFGAGFDEEEKNRLKEEARNQAGRMAQAFAEKIRPDVQSSAQQTIEALAKGFGAKNVNVDFSTSSLVPTKVEANLSESEKE